MLAGLVGTMAYTTYFAKKETTAIIGDTKIQPTYNTKKDKDIITQNFKLICKRGNAKLDKEGKPMYKNHYQPCCAYLEYQGFTKNVVDYFEKIYLQKYEQRHINKTKEIQQRHSELEQLFYNQYNNREIKIFRYWHSGDTESKCNKLMNNWFWSHIVKQYNIVKDGCVNIEVWTIYAPPVILKQIEKIYDEVCYLEKVQKF